MRPHPCDSISDAASFVEILRWRATHRPEQCALTFDAGGEDEGEGTALSFAALDRRARALAARLQELRLAGERALLLYPPGLDFVAAFVGCLYAGAVAVPAYLPRVNRPMTRLRAIVAEARPGAVLTTSAQGPDVPRWAEQIPELAGFHHLATDALGDDRADDWRDPGVGRETLAFLQYTSGSTADSKGVIVTHGNLLHNSALIHRCFESTPESRGVFWLPLNHDMGLIGGVLQTLYCGGASTLLSPVAFLQRPIRWLRAISRTRATISGGPNFAYDLCVRKTTPEQRAGLDLGHWSVAFNGAEPIRAETLDRFVEAFGPCGFRREAFLPCFGLAEGTLMVSGGPKSAPPVVRAVRPEALARDRVALAPADDPRARTLVGSGRVPDDQVVAIVHPEARTRCPADGVGEIWVAGPSVAQGYWGRPEATERSFRGTLADTGEGPFLRTGDLGFLHDGELFVTGRLKDLIIIRGRNVYPQDVEWTVARCHPALRPESGAAFSVEAGGEERLVVVHEVERQAKGEGVEAILQAIRQAVAEEHELDVHAIALLQPASLPKTSSGKVQRHACRAGFLEGRLEAVGSFVQEVAEEAPTAPAAAAEVASEAAAPSPAGPTARAIRDWLVARLATTLRVEPSALDVRRPFAGFGLGSLQAVGLAGDLQDWLGRPLSPTLVYEHPTIEALARHLAGEPDGAAAAPGVARPGEDDRIAILGIGCRFPGADGPEAFWRLLRDGLEAVGAVPADRWDVDAYYDPDPKAPGKLNTRRGGFLDQVDRFDAGFFGLSPREAARMDPQQRLLLEVAWEALEDAGQVPGRLAGSRTGVFVGISTNDYGRLQWDRDDPSDAYLITGNAASIAANRLSYLFDFRGPSLAIDTACSSSLVAVHLACQSLRSGESSLALAGGVNLILSPAIAAHFTKAGFLAPDGRCKAFDAGANGYVRGEGAGVVVLKPLARALSDGDPISAVIRGAAVNQDGRTNGLTAPNPRAQEAVLRDAYRRAGVAPGRVQYVEAHGTGTFLGDPIEAKALGAVLADGRPAGRKCLLGSVKSNIGHLEAAAGIAGLVKVALALTHGAIPPSLHFDRPNPHVPFDELPLLVPKSLVPWPAPDGPRLAGVSSFGFGGTNAHLVLEEAPRTSRAGEPPREDDVHLVPLSARGPEALRALARSYRDFLATTAAPLRDVAFTAGVRRSHHDDRLALVARSAAEAVELLEAFDGGESRPGLIRGRASSGRRPGLVFVFTGQGPQRWGMGGALLEQEPAFRVAIAACDRALGQWASWSLLEELTADESRSRLASSEVAQPALFALQVGLAALWRSWGIVPDAVVGHSLGEVAAAHVAGALSLDEALRIAFHRGRLMQRTTGLGLTAAVGLAPDDALRLVAEDPRRLTLAAVNGPRATTISGDPGAVRAAVRSLQERDVFARILDVAIAFHGPQMDPVRRDLVEALAGLRPAPAAIPLISTVTGLLVDGQDLDAAYWGRNVRETVRFGDAVEALIASGHETFLELGPHPALAGAIAQCLRQRDRRGTHLPSLRRDEEDRTVLLRALGALYAQGQPVDWGALDPAGQFLRLPSYPWQRERHWLEAEAPSRAPQGNGTCLTGSGNGGDNGTGAAPAYRNGNTLLSRNGATGTHAASEVHEDDLGDCLYELQWQPKDRPEPGTRAGGREGTWLIFEDARGVGRAVRSLLEARGASCVVVRHADTSAPSGAGGSRLDPADPVGFRRLVEDVARREGRPLRGVVHLWSLDAAAPAEASVAAIDAAQRLGCGSVLHLVQALAAAAGDLPPRLWLVTRGAQPAGPGPAALDVAQAPVWGMGRSIALEHPQLWGGLVDLDPDAPQGEALALAGELLDPDGEDQSAFRGGRRHVARLVRGDRPDHRAQALPVRPEGTYLITGGLGDLGLRVARWLVAHGARRLVLVARRGLPGREAWDGLAQDDPARTPVEAIRELERLGATVIAASADVGDPARMAALFDQVRGLLPPLRGIIHAAGVVTPLPLRDTALEALDAVLRPKVAGTWVLHRLTRDLPLDFFVAFSSISSVLGAPELAAYAAANQFLDAFAHAARATGRPVLSINWGPWQGEGMAATTERSRAMKLLGLRPLSPGRGLRALGSLAAAGTAQATVADVDWFTFKTIYEQRGHRFLEQVGAPPWAEPEASGDGPTWWRDPSPDRRRARLIEYFQGRIAEVLRMEPTRIDPERSLSTLGLDSLMALELKGGVEEDLKTVLPLTTLLQGPTIVELADQALTQWRAPASGPGPAAAPAPAAAPGPIAEHPASVGQRSLWLLHQLAPTSAAYNIGGAVRVRAELDVDVLRRSFQRLVDRHAALRTTFATVDGQPMQRVHDLMEAWFRAEDASSWSEEEVGRRLSDEAHRPFDLEAGPLFRAYLFTRSACDHSVLMTMHHAVSDLWSIAVLMRELSQVYPAERAGTVAELPATPLQYTDFARWQAEMLSGPEGERLWAYWREQLAGPLPVLDLPTDRPRPAVQTDRGDARALRLDPELTRALAALGRSRGASLHVTLLAAFQALLARLSNQDDIIVGTPVVGRNRPGLADVVGYFVNPLPIRADVSGRPTFEALLDQVRRAVHDGLEHQEFPFALMVDRLQPVRDPSRSPLFQVMFVFQKARRLDEEGVAGLSLREGGSRMSLGEFPLEAVALERRAAPFDLTLFAAVDEGRVVASLEYNTDLFDAATIDRMLGNFRVLLEGIVAEPGRCLCDLAILTEAEQKQMLRQWNGIPTGPAAEPRGPGAVRGPEELEGLSDEELDALLRRLLITEEDSDE